MLLSDCCEIWTGDSKNTELLISLAFGSLVTFVICLIFKQFRTDNVSSAQCKSSNCIRCTSNHSINESILLQIQSLDESHQRIKDALLQQSSFLQDVKLLEDNHNAVRAEFESAYVDARATWVANSTPTGEWTILHFMNQGVWNERNCRKCPATVSIIRRLKNLVTDCAFGNIAFSVVRPRTVLSEHCGSTNARMRCHLGLVIPERCKMSVGGHRFEWKEGRCTLFDDSFLHGVECDFDEGYRAVLMLDFWHPSLRDSERNAICLCYPPM